MQALQIDFLLFLEGRRLDAVVFHSDCLQLEFDYATLTAYTWPIILGEATDFTHCHAEYQNELCRLISQKITALTETAKGLVLSFDDTELLFPLDGIREILFIVNDNSEWYSYPIN